MSPNAVYATLLTKPAYLPGTLVLEMTLRLVGSKYPLVVMVTPGLPADARSVLQRREIKVIEVDILQPEEGVHSLAANDVRFKDTWTKLRCVELTITNNAPVTCFHHRAFDLVGYEV
jgi:hypothetical protein